MKRRGVWILALMLVVSAGLLFAAGADEAADSDSSVVELTWWNLSSRNELTEQVVADFNAAHPDIQVEAILNATNDHTSKLMVAASSGSLPDFWFNWGGSLGSFFPENGLSYDLSDYAAKNNWDDKFSETSLSLATLDGQLAGVPTSMAMIGMFYRKDVFNKVGIAEPATFEEFEAGLAALKAAGYTPMVLCGQSGWHVMRFVEAMIEMYAGSDEHDNISLLKSTWDQNAVVKAFAKYKEYIDLGYLPEGFISLEGKDAKNLLYSADAIMSPEGPWMESNIYAHEQNHDDYGYFRLPLSSKGNRMSGFVEMLQFNAELSDEELEAAMTFADWLYSPESISTYGALIKQPVPRTDNTLPDASILTREMIDDLNTYGSYTISDQGLPQEVASALFEAQDSVALGIMTPEEAAVFMQKSAEAYLASR